MLISKVSGPFRGNSLFIIHEDQHYQLSFLFVSYKTQFYIDFQVHTHI